VPDMARRDKDSKRVEGRKKQPFSWPLGSWQVGHRIHVGCGEEDRERNGGEQWTERNKGNGRGRVEP
jgi:hypothetical protein